jgi:hypothetical protein
MEKGGGVFSRRDVLGGLVRITARRLQERTCKILTITVPIPDHQLAMGTLLSIIRQSGIARTAFES